MSGVCPCCGQEVPGAETLLVSVAAGAASRFGVIARIEPKHAVILSALLRKHPGIVRYAEMIAEVWGWEEPEAPMKIMKVQMSRLRRSLAPLGVAVDTTHSVGWRLRLEPGPITIVPLRHRRGRAYRSDDRPLTKPSDRAFTVPAETAAP